MQLSMSSSEMLNHPFSPESVVLNGATESTKCFHHKMSVQVDISGTRPVGTQRTAWWNFEKFILCFLKFARISPRVQSIY